MYGTCWLFKINNYMSSDHFHGNNPYAKTKHRTNQSGDSELPQGYLKFYIYIFKSVCPLCGLDYKNILKCFKKTVIASTHSSSFHCTYQLFLS